MGMFGNPLVTGVVVVICLVVATQVISRNFKTRAAILDKKMIVETILEMIKEEPLQIVRGNALVTQIKNKSIEIDYYEPNPDNLYQRIKFQVGRRAPVVIGYKDGRIMEWTWYNEEHVIPRGSPLHGIVAEIFQHVNSAMEGFDEPA